MYIKHTIKPIYNNNSKILILGSIPSIISRKENFYYANESNRFWLILNNLFNVILNTKEDKIKFLLKNNIALWDVIDSCEIENSKDSSIKNIKVNNVDKIIKNSQIKIIFCTGKKAFQIYNKYLKNKINLLCICLSSPSSANANKNLNDLTLEYQVIKKALY